MNSSMNASDAPQAVQSGLEAWAPLTAEQIPLYLDYYARSATALADACPNSRFAWNPLYEYRYREIEGLLWLYSEGQQPGSRRHLTLPLGPLTAEALAAGLKTILAEGLFGDEPLTMLFVDEDVLPLLDSPALADLAIQVSTDRSYADYVYDAEKLRTLRGSAYKAKRNHVNATEREFLQMRFVDFQALPREDMCGLVRKWCRERGVDCSDPEESDAFAIRELLSLRDQLDIRGGALYEGQTMLAFCLGSYCPQRQTATIHFEKADPRVPGLFAAINKYALNDAFADALWVNREEDMGLPGLREAKESYHPAFLLHKYALSIRTKEDEVR